MIKINEKWGICADNNGYQVGIMTEITDLKTGKPKIVLKDVTYPSTIQSAIKSIMRKEQLDIVRKKDMTLQEAVNEFNRLYVKFEGLLNDILGTLEER